MSPGRHNNYSPDRQRHAEKRRLRRDEDDVDDSPSTGEDRRHRHHRRDHHQRHDDNNDIVDRKRRHKHDNNPPSPDQHRRKHHADPDDVSHRSKSRKKHHHADSDDESKNSHDRPRSPHIARDKRKDRHRDNHEHVRVKKEPRSPTRNRHNVRVKREPRSSSPQPRQASEFPRDPKPEKSGPDFGLSGKLTADTNTYKGVVIKYNQPPEARKPREKWRLYPFKGEECLPVVPLHRSSGYLIGRDRLVADIPVDHPSCSKQHSVLQFRLVDITKGDGTMGRKVKPYVIDLGSTNGTFLNGKRIDSERYHELREKDVLKFGFSSREYVLLHEKSQTEEVDEGFE